MSDPVDAFALTCRPRPEHVRIATSADLARRALMELVLEPRVTALWWAELTEQSPAAFDGHHLQKLASVITGIKGTKTNARGLDLTDGSEVKSCSRIDQMDTCEACRASVARSEARCSACGSGSIARKSDSKWLFAIPDGADRADILATPRVVLLVADYPRFVESDWATLRFRGYEIWPTHPRHVRFRELVAAYGRDIADPARTAGAQPAAMNLWPDKFAFYLTNPVPTFRALVTDASRSPQVTVELFTDPLIDRATLEPEPLPASILYPGELETLVRELPEARIHELTGLRRCELLELPPERRAALIGSLDEHDRLVIPLRPTQGHAAGAHRPRRLRPADERTIAAAPTFWD